MANPQHVTLTANTVTTLNFGDSGGVTVVNVDGAAAIYFTTNGTDPVVEGDGSMVVTAGVGAFTELSHSNIADTQVKLISAGTPKVSVQAW